MKATSILFVLATLAAMAAAASLGEGGKVTGDQTDPPAVVTTNPVADVSKVDSNVTVTTVQPDEDEANSEATPTESSEEVTTGKAGQDETTTPSENESEDKDAAADATGENDDSPSTTQATASSAKTDDASVKDHDDNASVKDQDDDASVKDQDDDAPVKDQDDDASVKDQDGDDESEEEGKKETSVSTQKTVSDEATTSKKPVSLSPNVSAIPEPRQDILAVLSLFQSLPQGHSVANFTTSRSFFYYVEHHFYKFGEDVCICTEDKLNRMRVLIVVLCTVLVLLNAFLLRDCCGEFGGNKKQGSFDKAKQPLSLTAKDLKYHQLK